MVDTWTYDDEIPKFARLDYWTGVPLMVFGNLLVLFSRYGYNYLLPFSFGLTILGSLFLLFSRFPLYLLESVDDKEEVTDARLIDINSLFFQLGPWKNQVLSGPYFGEELEQLKGDLK